MKTIFIRAVDTEDKAEVLRHSIKLPVETAGITRFDIDSNSFSLVPRSPFCYWVTPNIIKQFKEMNPLEWDKRKARVTNPAGDDRRFIRTCWELPGKSDSSSSRIWVPLCKGGSYSPFYFDVHLAVSWNRAVCSFHGFLGTEHRPLAKPASLEFFFRPGLTWSRRSQVGLSLRVMASGCVFADKGPAAFYDDNNIHSLLSLLAVTNSRVFKSLVELQMAFGSYEVGVIQRTPVPDLLPAVENVLANHARRAWSIKRSLDTINETSHAFYCPAVLQVTGSSIGDLSIVWGERLKEVGVELGRIQAEIDDRCFDLYGIHDDDRRRIEQGLGAVLDDGDVEPEAEDDAGGTEGSAADTVSLTVDLISWMVGAVYGRFDLRLVTGGRPAPAEPEPFDSLPVCSPGMLADESSQPAMKSPGDYPLEVAWSGILVDDPGHSDDVLTRIRQVFDVIWHDRSHNIYGEATEILNPGKDDFRPWFRSNFFADHIKRYSKSRRKAPIYWCLSTPSRSYSVWLYYHRVDRDTFYKVLNDYVSPKLQFEERKLSSLRSDVGATPTTSQFKLLAEQEKFVEELTTFRDEIALVAPLWNPNLNDGVIINFAPLWRLAPQPASWQKESKQTWDALIKEEYDWAYLAMYLWPERVVPKCQKDRSLAIAHDLEDALWEMDDTDKWRPREVFAQELEALIEKRSSRTVRDARDRLLAAPVASGGGRRKRTG